MSKDHLILLKTAFEDPAQPGKAFFCPHGIPLEGLLAAFPEKGAQVEVSRLDFPRPRSPVIALIGEENQSLPVLVLGDEYPVPQDAKTFGGRYFINDSKRIAAVLAERYGFPISH